MDISFSLRQAMLNETASSKEVSWRVRLLPFLRDMSSYDIQMYDESVPWNDSANRAWSHTRIPSYLCPSVYFAKDEADRWFTAYAMSKAAIVKGNIANGDRDTRDENRLIAVEAIGSRIIWTEARDIDMESEKPGVNLPGTESGSASSWVSSYLRGQVLGVTAGGKVVSISDQIDPTVLRKMLMPADQDDLP